MSGNQIITIVLIAICIYGFYKGWVQLTNGTGVLCSHIPQKSLKWLNEKEAGPIIVKILISLLLSYIFAVITLFKVIMFIIAFIFRIGA